MHEKTRPGEGEPETVGLVLDKTFAIDQRDKFFSKDWSCPRMILLLGNYITEGSSHIIRIVVERGVQVQCVKQVLDLWWL